MDLKEGVQENPAEKPVETKVETTKQWTPSDKSLTPKEAYELFREGKLNLLWAQSGISEEAFCAQFLDRSPVTPAAHKKLGEQSLRNHPVLRKWHITRAKAAGRQLTNSEAQTVKMEFFALQAKETDERKALIDLRPDDSSPAKDDGETCIVCETVFEPKTLFLTRDGQRVISKITGEPVRIGNYKLAKVNENGEVDPDGKLSIVGVCKECSMAVGGESYTYENAQKAIEDAEAEKATMQNRVNKATMLRKALSRPDGTDRFNTGNVNSDIEMTARFLDARRAKGKFQGNRRHR